MDIDSLMDILAAPLTAGLLVLGILVPLGFQVLQRKIIFIDLALAQMAALGVVAGQILDLSDHHPMASYGLSALFALTGAGLFALLERHWKQELEPLIGCGYVLSAALALLLLAHDPHGGELVKQTLSGSILWVTWSDLLYPALVFAGLGLILLIRPGLLSSRLFYPLFAITITSAVKLVGVYLVFATLVMPAVGVYRRLANRYLPAYTIGIAGYLGGLLISALADLPAGAVIVCTLAAAAMVIVGSGNHQA